MEIRTAHTADLDPATLRAVRSLLGDAFGEDLSDHDWEHALGGMHALVWEGAELVAHGSLVQRRMLHGGRALRTGYVEAVGVLSGMRRRGYGAAVMAEMERLIRGGYDLGALSSSEEALTFYAARGWEPWRGPSWALTPGGVTRTEEEDDGIYVLPVTATLDPEGDLTCDWRDGDVW
ncbi:aminoglycoside 2'-N-acetyltransferase [Planotetraspora thailandica]|uniref:Aminoglycoside 2'-N-acetyltransferase n=1 Tax=Planotetraspora thailandica TaxID=487172 RepID=A0A8J3XZ15_9ACTN|nr:GNAT family N-acetyltransferase [Planotetraspora thailandica]GII55788.1 aminoglycoside 2'-N-acetyltransferase [Planotetraspora thailandica]